MTFATMILTMGLAGAMPAQPGMLPDSAAFATDATGWLLEGQPLPPDYHSRLMQMSPAARLQALIYLRRAGLLTNSPWPLADILQPPPAAISEAGQQ